ncbi:MAG: molybdopterin molybdenumtransferase MoeA [Proteobacteria bacterium]|nr:molybdopterin molybdenumtransferase MoeA [Pseudomonadota bacterium]
MINYNQATAILNKAKIKISDEIINTTDSLNRISALNIKSQSNHPADNNAAFDGFAVRSKDTKNFSQKFRIIGSIAAGNKPFKKKIKKFDAVEIMTGGIIPQGFDTIIPIEQIVFLPNKKNPQYILVNKKIKQNEHVRFLGSDYKKNDLIIKKGTIINSSHILALKTLGISKIKVKRKPNILFFSTGNEISNKDNIPNWQVRNSNSHYIKSLENKFLFNFISGNILKDDHEHLFKKQIKKMLNSKIDMIITSGAVSAGKFDFVPSVINSFKLSNYFKGVAIRPGKPVLFAKIQGKQKVIFGLPGNPISSAACFRFFVHPFLMNSLGASPEKPIKAILKNSFQKKKDFTRFIKSKITTTQNGKLELEVLQGQESFRIRSFVNSNIWAVFPSGKSTFKKGDLVDCFYPNFSNSNLI